ncbi:carbohydrate sulfotransferase 11-like [Tubulanus polymorphus]|uniref:carbohydrate sulfotransferase 11-like n=1 Tax=Tubulanus polymorphus TaxID=672921 RepID=UPI003DA45FCE
MSCFMLARESKFPVMSRIILDSLEEIERLIRKQQAERKARLLAACRRQGFPFLENRLLHTRAMLVNRKYKFVYCYAPKVASSTLRFVMMQLRRREDPHQSHVESIAHLNQGDVRKILTDSSFIRFMFVRNPWSRLLSAFRDKFLNVHNMSKFPQIYWPMLDKYVGLKVYDSTKNGGDTLYSVPGRRHINFENFLRFVTDGVWDTNFSNFYNEHWDLFYRLCRPCDMGYDFIGKYETFAQDYTYLMRKLGIHNLTYMALARPHTSEEYLNNYYRMVDRQVINKVREFYKWDFEMFGYDDYGNCTD